MKKRELKKLRSLAQSLKIAGHKYNLYRNAIKLIQKNPNPSEDEDEDERAARVLMEEKEEELRLATLGSDVARLTAAIDAVKGTDGTAMHSVDPVLFAAATERLKALTPNKGSGLLTGMFEGMKMWGGQKETSGQVSSGRHYRRVAPRTKPKRKVVKRKVVKRKVYRNPKTGARYHLRKSKVTGRMYKQYLPRR